MPRKRSAATQAALDDISSGMSQAAAARKHGVDQGMISRMLRPNEKTVNVKLTLNDILGLLYSLETPETDKKLFDAISKLEEKNK